MTDLRKLLDAATKGPWLEYNGGLASPERRQVTVWNLGVSHGARGPETEANGKLIVAAVNALPALLDIVEAAQRHTAAVYRKATCDAAGAFDASVEFEDSYNALTAALAQWEKQ